MPYRRVSSGKGVMSRTNEWKKVEIRCGIPFLLLETQCEVGIEVGFGVQRDLTMEAWRADMPTSTQRLGCPTGKLGPCTPRTVSRACASGGCTSLPPASC